METLLKYGAIGLGIIIQLATFMDVYEDIKKHGRTVKQATKNFIIRTTINWISMYLLFHLFWTVIPLAITEGIPAVFNLLCKAFDVSPMMFIGGCIGLYVLYFLYENERDHITLTFPLHKN